MKKWAQKQTDGFTIVELLIVVVVIAILAAITIVAFNGIQAKARDSKRASETRAIVQALEMYVADNGSYPSVGTDNIGYPLTRLNTALVPKYISAIPTPPSGGSSADYQYVRGPESTLSYGIRVDYETKPRCHVGQKNAGIAWWSLPAC